MTTGDTLSLQLTREMMGVTMSLLGQGVGIRIETGLTLASLLHKTLEISPQYVENRIQTMLVNSQAIDQLDQVRLMPGDTVALGAVMPGLVGMTLRKAGHLAAMRKEISYKAPARDQDAKPAGFVMLKLFNLVARDLGPEILSKGIWLNQDRLSSFLSSLPNQGGASVQGSPHEWVKIHIQPPKA